MSDFIFRYKIYRDQDHPEFFIMEQSEHSGEERKSRFLALQKHIEKVCEKILGYEHADNRKGDSLTRIITDKDHTGETWESFRNTVEMFGADVVVTGPTVGDARSKRVKKGKPNFVKGVADISARLHGGIIDSDEAVRELVRCAEECGKTFSRDAFLMLCGEVS